VNKMMSSSISHRFIKTYNFSTMKNIKLFFILTAFFWQLCPSYGQINDHDEILLVIHRAEERLKAITDRDKQTKVEAVLGATNELKAIIIRSQKRKEHLEMLLDNKSVEDIQLEIREDSVKFIKLRQQLSVASNELSELNKLTNTFVSINTQLKEDLQTISMRAKQIIANNQAKLDRIKNIRTINKIYLVANSIEVDYFDVITKNSNPFLTMRLNYDQGRLEELRKEGYELFIKPKSDNPLIHPNTTLSNPLEKQLLYDIIPSGTKNGIYQFSFEISYKKVNEDSNDIPISTLRVEFDSANQYFNML